MPNHIYMIVEIKDCDSDDLRGIETGTYHATEITETQQAMHVTETQHAVSLQYSCVFIM